MFSFILHISLLAFCMEMTFFLSTKYSSLLYSSLVQWSKNMHAMFIDDSELIIEVYVIVNVFYLSHPTLFGVVPHLSAGLDSSNPIT